MTDTLTEIKESRPGVNRTETPGRRKRDVENDEYLRFMRRILRAIGKRVGAGDIDTLAELVKLRDDLDEQILATVAELRGPKWQYSWAQIGDALGITRQAAQKRFAAAGGARKPGGQPSNLR